MQNLIQKSKQNSIALTKPGLPENLKNFDELQLLYSSIFFAENLHTFPNYQFLQKGVLDFLCFVQILSYLQKLGGPGFYTLVFYIIIDNSKPKQNKNIPNTLFQSLLSRKHVQNSNQKYKIWQLELVKIFSFSDKKNWFLEIIDVYFSLGKGFCAACLVLPNYEEMSP